MKKGKIILIILTLLLIMSLLIKKNNYNDTIKYENKTYILLEYNMDIFTYYFNSNNYYETDIIHPIYHNKWNIIYFNGDLFVLDKQIRKVTNYYKNDKNYDWYISFDEDDSEIRKSVSINKDELMHLYNIENEERNDTITFSEIEKFASILKISKDSLVQGIITLVQVKEYWYYNTEIMTDDDTEYENKIPKSLNDKINNLFNE